MFPQLRSVAARLSRRPFRLRSREGSALLSKGGRPTWPVILNRSHLTAFLGPVYPLGLKPSLLGGLALDIGMRYL